MSTLSLVVAYCRANRAIGLRNSLPWPRLSEDMARFARLTTHHSIIMGRRTLQSDEVNGIPLPHRRNIVLSRSLDWVPPPEVVIASDFEEAILLAQTGFGAAGYQNRSSIITPNPVSRHIFVVGGASVYKAALERGTQWVFATEIEGDWAGDSFFPQLPQHEWTSVKPEHCPQKWASATTMHENGVSFSFLTYKRNTI